MITINVQTKAVTLDRDTPVMARNQFGNATYGYVRGHLPPNYPVPAIRTMADNAHRLIAFGEITAENGFHLPTVFELYVKLK